jgi:hypothetical protein
MSTKHPAREGETQLKEAMTWGWGQVSKDFTEKR